MADSQLTHLERRKIEGGVLIPMVQAFQRAIGKEQANAIARDVISRTCPQGRREMGAAVRRRSIGDAAGLRRVVRRRKPQN